MISHYMLEYGYVPLWVLVNALTLGSISKFYSYLSQKDQNDIGRRFLLKPDEMNSVLQVLTIFRNACAHDERLYNLKAMRRSILLIRSTLFLRRWLGKNNKSAQNFHQGRFVPELAAGSRDPCIDIIDGGPVEICNLNRLISLQLQLNGLDAFPSNTLVLLLTGAQRCHSGIVGDLCLEVNGGMGKQIKEHLALFKTCIYTSLESVIHRTAVIDNGIVDIATCEGCEFAAIRLVLQSGTADGLTTDGIEVIIGQ